MSLREYLGDIDTFTASYEFEKMVTVRRKDLTVRTNWKSYIENSLENFHLPTVHQGTIGGVKAQWNPIDGAPGNYVLLQSRTTASRATLGGDAAFDRIATLRGPAAEGAQYILIYPCSVIGADLDCMWFKQMAPDGPHMVQYSAGFCFPKASVERPDFAQIVPNYHKRFDLVISEDNGIAEAAVAGTSPIRSAGPDAFPAWSPWCTRSTTGSSTASWGSNRSSSARQRNEGGRRTAADELPMTQARVQCR